MKEILDPIPFLPDIPALLKKTRTRPGSSMAADLERLAAQAAAIARPRAAYRLAFIDRREPDQVVIEGTAFHSRVLSVNLEAAQRVFVLIATAGEELDAWARGHADLLERYWADAVQESALYAAYDALNARIDQRYQPGRTGVMSPGSLEDWPISQQRPLFALLDGLAGQVGVTLTDSLLMVPVKSLTMLRFPKEETFVSCQLCPRISCPNRRAPYDADLYDRKYRSPSTP